MKSQPALRFNRFGGQQRRSRSTVSHDIHDVHGEPPAFLDTCTIRTSTPVHNKPRVLCFTPSSGRPEHLIRCILQVQSQTYHADHAVFINDQDAAPDKNYISLIQSVIKNPKSNIHLSYGQSGHQHSNYLNALKSAPLEHYHLFLKIDDDDFYSSDYVQLCVDDWIKNRWSFSGCYANGYMNTGKWLPHRILKSLGENSRDIELGVVPVMPPTYAFDSTAIEIIMDIEDDGRYEDMQWRVALARNDIRAHVRGHGGFIYNIHGENISKPSARPSTHEEAKSVSEHIFMATGLVTAPRFPPTIQQTYESLCREGLTPIIYAEPDSVIPEGNVEVVQNEVKLGVILNTYHAFKDLVQRYPSAIYYAVFQDDIEIVAGLHDYLRNGGIPQDTGIASLFTANPYLKDEPGWNLMDLGYYRTFGAMGMVMSNTAVRRFLDSEYVKSKLPNRTGCDATIGEFASRSYGGIYLHSPSLIKHRLGASTLRSWELGPIINVETVSKTSELLDWKPNRRDPKIGLVGWNTAQGLGYLNRDIVTHLPIDRWIIPQHKRFPDLPDIKNVRSVHTTVDANIQDLRDMLEGLDAMLFCELPYINKFAGITRECGIPNICIPMWEWLHQGLPWLKYIDVFICPTQCCYRLLVEWREQMGLKWDVRYVPWPIDVNKFQFKQRDICRSFLFNNGTGGGMAYKRNGGRHGPRKGIDTVISAARVLSKIPFTIRTQVPIPNTPHNVRVIGETATNEGLYEYGDVALQPSRYEGIGLQMLEAQACGLPIITTDAPPMNEYKPMFALNASTEDGRVFGERWIQVNNPNLKQLIKNIKQAHESDISLQSAAARQFVCEVHSWEAQRENILKIIT